MLDLSLILMAMILTVIASFLAVMVWNKSKRGYRKPFVLLMISQMLIMWGYSLEVSSDVLESKLFWNVFEYVGYVCAITSFFLFTVQYSRDIKLNRPLAAILGIPSLLVVLIVATNPYHNLFYLNTALSSSYYRSFDAEYGPLFYGYMAYALVIMIAGLVSLVVSFTKASNAHRSRVGITCLASFIAVTPVLINFSALSSIPGGITFLMGFISSDLLLFLGAFSFEIFSMVPFELERVMQLTRGGVFVLDDKDVIMYQNPTAESLTGKKDSAYVDKLCDALPTFPRELLDGRKESRIDVEDVYELVPGRLFDVTVLPIQDYAGHLIGKTITLREMTAQRRAEAEALAAKRTLDLMNTITRHDVLNQLTVIEGHLILGGSISDPVAMHKHIDASYQAALSIQKHMQFARDYQEMATRTPVWQNVEEKALEASTTLDLKGARLDVDTKGLEILADRLLEKVLYNMMHNSIAHGGKVSLIRFEAAQDESGLQLIYTDDGAGIAQAMKATLFTKGAGTNSGLGLFLTREILAHSGMTIAEEGEPGHGVRFVIRVPPGSYRGYRGLPMITRPLMAPPALTP